jgi:hypothetical protein
VTTPSDDRGVAFWRVAYRAGYRVLRAIEPLIRRVWRMRPGVLRGVVRLDLMGRRTGRPRSLIVTVIKIGDREYIGHPNGNTAWTRNLEATDTLRVVEADGSGRQMRAIRLGPGAERESVIRATWSQQPCPANLVYSAARAHVRRVGVFFRLEPTAPNPPQLNLRATQAQGA